MRTFYNPEQHQNFIVNYGFDLGTGGQQWEATVLWMLGYPSQALARAQAALTLAQQLAHPFSLGWAMCWLAEVHYLRREFRAVERQVDEVVRFTDKHGFSEISSMGVILQGWVSLEQGKEEDSHHMSQSIAAYHKTGGGSLTSHFLMQRAEAYEKIGRVADGLRVIDEALTFVSEAGMQVWAAELHRLKGELSLRQLPENQLEAEACFQQALSIARQQDAKSWELRAATSLARLWKSQGNTTEARDLLAPVYDWFTEGFDTADLKDAKALLTELAEGA